MTLSSGFEDDGVRRVTTVSNSPASQSTSIKILELDSLTGAISDMASAAASDPSYPPFLDGGAVIPSVSPIATAAEPLEIPVIDLANLEPNRIGDACRSLGIFRVTNHGLPEGLSAQIQAEARRILELPFERKRDDLSSAASGGRPVVYFWGTPAINLRLPSLNWLEGLHMPVSGIRSWDSGEWSAGLGFSPSFRQSAMMNTGA
ncbi:Gibberellin 2-beta-dioxygenase 8 [Apostasia shenzhenica]|uniref:Gibberellin 2-beta-dioxygenase 8 n=1 Tax=Apostasia shenzhenica TaxID=1088818 RepID=A0A2I0BGI1_9ASPA|nr:Gibberellin 2-beta-dioxygenase 8 [Apostasia shenzhenica]